MSSDSPAKDAPNEQLPEPPKGLTGKALRAAVERALRVQQPLVASHVAKIRRDKPNATPAEVIAGLDKQYLLAAGGLGAAAGGAAFLPGIGTVASLGTAAAEAVAALDASVLYTLAVAEVHGQPMRDVEHRRALVLAIVLGEGGAQLMRKVTGRSTNWAQGLADAVPLPKLGPVNQILVRWFIKRFAVRQGALALGRALPLGAGALIGATGNLAIAKGVIRSAERAFGPPPARWPDPEPEPAPADAAIEP
ncbi:hypothetical protein [Pseudonocardia acaciae]|uniref:hypothetical protein n=1 Tax=Pseudonocardia acaciae TaxID=551276 RepID=UPI00048B6729|nr:hypothetical protein [Pseudonocardia acaciae]